MLNYYSDVTYYYEYVMILLYTVIYLSFKKYFKNYYNNWNVGKWQ